MNPLLLLAAFGLLVLFVFVGGRRRLTDNQKTALLILGLVAIGIVWFVFEQIRAGLRI